MNIKKILDYLEKSWVRDDILLKIKNGHNTDEIVNEYLLNNKVKIKELNTLLRPQDLDLFNQVVQLSICESKLINKIINLDNIQNNAKDHTTNEEKVYFTYSVPANKISLFMINWSNKFVVIALLTISAIALSKQAWA